jgi:hypothetical protein
MTTIIQMTATDVQNVIDIHISNKKTIKYNVSFDAALLFDQMLPKYNGNWLSKPHYLDDTEYVDGITVTIMELRRRRRRSSK